MTFEINPLCLEFDTLKWWKSNGAQARIHACPIHLVCLLLNIFGQVYICLDRGLGSFDGDWAQFLRDFLINYSI